MLESRRFTMHAVYMIQMLDSALQMLGPDDELLTEIMLELGVKHQRYGVKPEMFTVMGDSLIKMLEVVLEGSFDTETRAAWVETYAALSQDMVKAQVKRSR